MIVHSDAPVQPAVLFTGIRGYALYSARGMLMQEVRNRGVRVIAASTDGESMSKIRQRGIEGRVVPYARGGLRPARDARCIRRLRQCVQECKPDLVHCFQPKPLILAAFAGRLPRQTKLVATITGLGELENLLTRRPMCFLARPMFRQALRRCGCVIFQNPDDLALFRDLQLMAKEQAVLMPGSGVDIRRFTPCASVISWAQKPLRVFMASRLLWSKGIAEFFEAAAICHQNVPNVSFEIAGEFDPEHKQAVSRQWMRTHDGMSARYVGYVSDMAKKLSEVDIVVHPTYYREGVPRILLEAAAMGVPIVATNVAGCREAVKDGEDGILVPPRDSDALAAAIQRLVRDPLLRRRMGLAGRRLAEEQFDIRRIIERHVSIYEKLGVPMQQRASKTLPREAAARRGAA